MTDASKPTQPMLVMSDDSGVHRIAAEVARVRNYKLVEVEGDGNLHDAWGDRSPELIFLDLDKPACDGLTLLGRLAADSCTATIALTGGCSPRTLHVARQVGAMRGLKMGPALVKPAHERAAAREIIGALPAREPKVTAADIRRALREGQFRLYYQPLVRIEPHRIGFGPDSIYGVEALLRWEHPEHGLLLPMRVIEVAENEGLIGELTRWVTSMSLRQLRAWLHRGWNFKMAVNIAAEELRDAGFADVILDLIEDAGVKPEHLVLEITESQVLAEEVEVLESLARLSLAGIELAIDDFGTGYSSLGRLHSMPFREIKIDKSFVMTAVDDRRARDIVRIISSLGRSLDMVVVAEGVATSEEWKLVSELGCDVAQGFYISKPISAEHLSGWLTHLGDPKPVVQGGLGPLQQFEEVEEEAAAVLEGL